MISRKKQIEGKFSVWIRKHYLLISCFAFFGILYFLKRKEEKLKDKNIVVKRTESSNKKDLVPSEINSTKQGKTPIHQNSRFTKVTGGVIFSFLLYKSGAKKFHRALSRGIEKQIRTDEIEEDEKKIEIEIIEDTLGDHPIPQEKSFNVAHFIFARETVYALVKSLQNFDTRNYTSYKDSFLQLLLGVNKEKFDRIFDFDKLYDDIEDIRKVEKTYAQKSNKEHLKSLLQDRIVTRILTRFSKWLSTPDRDRNRILDMDTPRLVFSSKSVIGSNNGDIELLGKVVDSDSSPLKGFPVYEVDIFIGDTIYDYLIGKLDSFPSGSIKENRYYYAYQKGDKVSRTNIMLGIISKIEHESNGEEQILPTINDNFYNRSSDNIRIRSHSELLDENYMNDL